MNIFQKMQLATMQIEKVAKNLKVEIGKSGGSYKAVSEGDVLRAVKPIEAELGIYSYPVARNVIETATLTTVKEYNDKKTESNQLFMRLETVYRFVNIEQPDEFIDITTYGDGVDSQDKAPGKAMTYADKYALLKAYKIETGDDPDKDGSQELKKVEKKTDRVDDKLFAKIINSLNPDEVLAYAEYFKVKSLADITQEQAMAIVKKRGIQ